MKMKRFLSEQYGASTAEVSSKRSVPKEVLTRGSDVSNGSLNVRTNASRLDPQSSKCLPGCWGCAFFNGSVQGQVFWFTFLDLQAVFSS